MGFCPVPRESLAPSDWELATALVRDAGYSPWTANAVVGLMNVAGLRHLASATTGVDLVRLHNLRVLEAGERAVAGVVGSVDAGARAYAATAMSGIGQGSSLPRTRADLHMDLRSKGYNYHGTTRGGYVSYRHANGTDVWIKPSGEVIPVQNHIRLDYYGNRLPAQCHSTGHFVEALGE